MTRENVKVRPGYEFDHYFPRAKLITIVKKKDATVADTLKLIPAVIRETAFHTRKFAHEVIKADTLEQTCRNIWEFVFNHIAYKKDEDGKEQVRSPARAWHDRHNFEVDENGNFVRDALGNKVTMGVDCDCMSLFICSVLYNLEIKNVYFRITKYKKSHWEHIYPIVKLPGGRQITIDCVMFQFNQEEPYTEKQDTAMDLEYLNGVTDSTMNKLSDATDLMGIMDEQEALSTLGKIFKKKSSGGGGGAPPKKGIFKKKAASGGGAPAKKGFFKKPSGGGKKPLFKKPLIKKKTPEQKKERKAKVKKFIGKGLHVTNRINPVTVALRNGVLAGMKLNFLKIGENLRWAYLTPEQAQAKGADMDRYQKLKGVLDKLEKIFNGAGGKPENLKKAILTGRGNRDKAVPMNGLGDISGNVDGLHEEMPLNQLLGPEIYYSENIQGMEGLDGFEGLEGFGELGDLGAATAASVAAASTVLTTIAGLIKSIGSLFPNKGKESKGASSKKAARKAKKGGSDSALTNEEGTSETSEDGGSEQGGDAEGGGDPAEGEGSEGSAAGERSSGPSEGEQAAGGDESSTAEAGDESEGATNGGAENTPAAKGGDDTSTSLKASTIAKAKTFWQNNKKWITRTGYVAGALGLILLAYKVLKGRPSKPSLGLQGIKGEKKRKPKKHLLSGIKSKKGGKHHAKGHRPKKKMIALL